MAPACDAATGCGVENVILRGGTSVSTMFTPSAAASERMTSPRSALTKLMWTVAACEAGAVCP